MSTCIKWLLLGLAPAGVGPLGTAVAVVVVVAVMAVVPPAAVEDATVVGCVNEDMEEGEELADEEHSDCSQLLSCW